jgi:hypothetical protein
LSKLSKEKLPEVFSSLITVSLKRQKLELSQMAEDYVVSVVSDLSSAAHDLAPRTTAVADLLRKGLNSDGYVRASYLRVAGDVALFVSGIFPDRFESRKVYFTLGDYIDMGRQAYGGIRVEVFDELSIKFSEVVSVLNTVSDEIDLLSRDIQRYINRRRSIDALSRR